ncbi:MAG: RNA 2',3'-cyclic phosphodiesterase [Pseudomonadota bacterium]|nr:RNA 2',3'-cyclic phosphodiesterase [Pseudomonadota bacterium]
MRCFVGVPVTGPLARECKELSLGLPRATPRPNLHLTLAFLGQCSPGGAVRLGRALHELVQRFPPFELSFERCEPFPAEQGPFLALTTTVSEPLAALHQALWERLVREGVEREERAFRPHITLAKPGLAMAPQVGHWRLTVDQLCLYQSELIQGEVPTYRPLSQHLLSARS